jgi:hypothetical protein
VNIAVVNVPVGGVRIGGRLSSGMRTLKRGNKLRELADQFIVRAVEIESKE